MDIQFTRADAGDPAEMNGWFSFDYDTWSWAVNSESKSDVDPTAPDAANTPISTKVFSIYQKAVLEFLYDGVQMTLYATTDTNIDGTVNDFMPLTVTLTDPCATASIATRSEFNAANVPQISTSVMRGKDTSASGE